MTSGKKSNTFRLLRGLAAVAVVASLSLQQAYGWGAYGHRMINRLAAAYLPKDVPVFLRNGAAQDEMEYLGPEPDHWRGKGEPALNAATTPEHFLDMEWANLVSPLPSKRYDYVRALDKAQAAHPDIKMTPENVGLLPWQTDECYERLKSAFRDYRSVLAAGQDTKPVEGEILFLAGWLGHYVADGSQPLHATIQYNGWTGPNPNNYSTSKNIHSQFETVFVTANITTADIEPLIKASAPKAIDGDLFEADMAYLRTSNAAVEKLYQLDKTGAFTGAGTSEGKKFVEERMAAGAIELRDMIYTAWLRSADPVETYKGPV